MAVKRGGLGKGLDSLIPDHKPSEFIPENGNICLHKGDRGSEGCEQY